jgi:hypothetical protein
VIGEARRPDLLADVAKLRATDANIAAARSAMDPTVKLGGFIQFNAGTINVDQGPYSSVAQPQGEVLLTLNWPLYEGGLLQNKLQLAQSQREEAADELKLQTDQALREVALAYDQIETGLDQYDAAVALQAASEAAFLSARDSYAHGVGTLTEAASAQTGLATARRGCPDPRAVAGQRGSPRLRDGRADVERRFHHRDTSVMPEYGERQDVKPFDHFSVAHRNNNKTSSLYQMRILCQVVSHGA